MPHTQTDTSPHNELPLWLDSVFKPVLPEKKEHREALRAARGKNR